MKRKKKKSNAGRPDIIVKSCIQTLRNFLHRQGESPAADLTERLLNLGYGQSTINKAKKRLQVKSRNEWKWSLPPSLPPHPDPQLEKYS